MRLSRATWAAGAPWPVRIVHLGPGAFFRAHPAWATWRAGDGWGVAAVGRSQASVADLRDQDGLFTVLARGPERDEASVVTAVSSVAHHVGRLLDDPAVGVVTLTVTEAGYRPGSAVLADLAGALTGRAARGGAPLAVVVCDNLAGGGPLLRDRLVGIAPGLAGWIATGACTFPSGVVDRITPAATDADRGMVAGLISRRDRAAVVAEPAFEWVVEDAFPAGRPAWERAGALVVADAAPWSTRKLRLLNGGHSLLAYVGGAAGHRYVHDAAADPTVSAALDGLWHEARAAMGEDAAALGGDTYLAGLRTRWANRRLPHLLEQIAADGSTKLGERVVPTLLVAAAQGRPPPPASAGVVGAWVAHLRGSTTFPVRDARAGELVAVTSLTLDAAVTHALGVLDGRLLDDPALRREVVAAARRYRSR